MSETEGNVTGQKDEPQFIGVVEGVYHYTVSFGGVRWNFKLAPELMPQYNGIMAHFYEEVKKDRNQKSIISRIKDNHAPPPRSVMSMSDAVRNYETSAALDEAIKRIRNKINDIEITGGDFAKDQ